jgi:hypothetical protein
LDARSDSLKNLLRLAHAQELLTEEVASQGNVDCVGSAYCLVLGCLDGTPIFRKSPLRLVQLLQDARVLTVVIRVGMLAWSQ